MRRQILFAIVLLAAALWLVVLPVGAEDLNFERERAKSMLEIVSREVERNFYDPGMKGLDWKALTDAARQRVERAKSVGEMFTAIYSLLDKLQDSHTRFIPPERVVEYKFGFQAKPFGDEIRIYELKKDGAAAAAGFQLGDRLLGVNGYNADRSRFDLMMFYYRLLRPVGALQIAFARGQEPPRTVTVQAKVEQGKMLTDLTKFDSIFDIIREAESERKPARYNTFDDRIGYFQLPSFSGSEDFMRGLVGKVKNTDAVIVDLRGNLGGRLDRLTWFSGFFEDDPRVIAEIVGRKKTEEVRVKPHKLGLTGPMFILVDSETSSAAEIFARHFQRIGRAKVIGDRTAGRVTAAHLLFEHVGMETVNFFVVSVAAGRVVFPGGEELEKRGVAPDVPCLPSGEDLREEHDPCRALAIRLAGEALGLPEKPPAKQEKQNRNQTHPHWVSRQ